MTNSIYLNTSRKNKSGIVYAFGRDNSLHGKPLEVGGYEIWKIRENYDGAVHGGARKSWCLVKNGLSHKDAATMMNKRLGRVEFAV